MRGRLTKLSGPLVGFVIGLWITAHAWGPNPPSGDDLMGVIVRVNEGVRVLGEGHLDGWSPKFITGFPIFLHYGTGLSVVFFVIRALSFFQLSATGAVSVLLIVSYASVAPAAWFLARSFGMSDRASMVAGILALGVSSPFGVGVQSIWDIGLATQALAAPFVLVALGSMTRLITRPTEKRWGVIAAACLTFVFVTHVLSTLIAGMLGAVVVLVALLSVETMRARLVAVRQLVVVSACAIGMAAFWLVPYLVHLHDRGIVTGWDTPTLHQRMDDIVDGHFLLGHYVALFVVAGWAWALVAARRGNRLALAGPIASMAFMVFAHWYHVHSPGGELALGLANRGVGYAGVLAILPVGGFVDEISPGPSTPALLNPFAVALALVVVAVIPGKPGLRSVPRQQKVPAVAMYTTAKFLHDVVPNGARFATERDLSTEFVNLNVTHPDLWLAKQSGRNTVNNFGLELTQTPDAGGLAERLRDDAEGKITASALARYGVTHLVTVEPRATARLVATGQFTPLLEAPPLTVLALDPPPSHPRPPSLMTFARGRASATLVHVSKDSEHYRMRVHATRAARASIAVGWSPSWRVHVDGERVHVRKAKDGLVSFDAPEGRHTVTLDFHRDHLGVLGLLIGVGAVFGLRRWARRA